MSDRPAMRLLAVHAHPDDESLTMAATLASAAASGVGVTLVTCTLGEQGEVIGDELAGLAAEHADQLGGYRYTELREACRVLRVRDHRMLAGAGSFRDSGMAGTPSADHPRAFVRAADGGPDTERAVAALAAVVREVDPQVVLTYDADGGYGHPDHIAAHQITVAAVRRTPRADGQPRRLFAVVKPATAVQVAVDRYETPPGYHRSRPEDLGFRVADHSVDAAVPVGPWAPVRREALAAHATQVELLAGGFALSNRVAQPDPLYECYRLLDGPALPGATDPGSPAVPGRSGPTPLTGAADLFAGLR
ncbi:N-acetyl-1-D-myo-inositol-2-amino-2-deoxy-alpha-D-glucopyranoside deacetylase [Nakamurella leprariae]|uniref:1D-myo-inositol 2-acetamido-2-deoxy-alpha-D-glucopyranoside deacetylase n=1 Tax=Nakamurella leprariae TaxID=2803911 RepID=A0A939BZL3_9ACTN|nr:N-acetyl-1-D-myo-inositol-2-amino-2-deoxy-alpha-D-glucopyranoside deacetylase [Nakamurella leprariae]MBM9468280.1 N-acetyl-1-D-myo-inositol-2-amino-2-deoxy-alpha-D-glucopyranoside deacetylase [Nakamurella leprariae]